MNKTDLLLNLENNNEFNALSPREWASIFNKPFYKISKIICSIDGYSAIYTPDELPGSDSYFFSDEPCKINVEPFAQMCDYYIKVSGMKEKGDGWIETDFNMNNWIITATFYVNNSGPLADTRVIGSWSILDNSCDVTVQIDFYYGSGGGEWEA